MYPHRVKRGTINKVMKITTILSEDLKAEMHREFLMRKRKRIPKLMFLENKQWPCDLIT